MRYTLTFREEQRAQLQGLLTESDGKERAAYILCALGRIREDPWTGSGARRLFAREVIPVDDIISNSESHVTWRTDSFVRLVGRCEREDLSIFIAHNHAADADSFSLIDDQNERRLFPYALDKLGSGAITGSLIQRSDGSLTGRVWLDHPLRSERIDSVATIGDRWRFETCRVPEPSRDMFQRQAILLGDGFNGLVSMLRVGVVGCGATGSAAAMLLARLGFGYLLLIDADTTDVTNLNRLHGATQSDADAGRKKAAVLRDAIAALGLGCKVRAISRFVEESEVRDALRSCDIIVASTDDHLGRSVLNRLAYFYSIPVVDIGVSLRLRTDGAGLSHADGRVTVLQPGAPCLLCREVLNPKRMQADAARRGDPETYERLKAEGYIVGAGDPSPAVVTFTTEIASMGVNEVIQRLAGFRGVGGHANQRYRHFLDSEDSTSTSIVKAGCRVCGRTNWWGRGDREQFLELVL